MAPLAGTLARAQIGFRVVKAPLLRVMGDA
jgi:hypothetical protein